MTAGADDDASQAHATGEISVAKRSQAEFEIEFFERVLERSPDYVDVLRRQGDLLNLAGQHQRALGIDERLAQLVPNDCLTHYNLACSLARVGRTDDALDALGAAFLRGYRDFSYLDRDADLDTLRDHPSYRELLETYRDSD